MRSSTLALLSFSIRFVTSPSFFPTLTPTTFPFAPLAGVSASDGPRGAPAAARRAVRTRLRCRGALGMLAKDKSKIDGIQ